MGAFGKIRHTTIKGEKGTDWYVELWKEGHTDASIDMTLAGEGFTITWNGEGSTRNRNFLGSECVLNLFVQNDTDEDLLYNILSSGFRKYFIRIYKNSTAASSLWWFGWISPAFDTIENAPYPYQSSITATDSYGYYSKLPIDLFENDGADNYNVVMNRNHNVADICVDFIKNMGLYTDAGGDNHPFPGGTSEDFVRIAMDWTTSADSGSSTPPMERYFICKAAFVLNENFPREYRESDVFKDILKMFNLTGVLAEGKYYFFQPNKYLDNAAAANTFYGYDDISPVTHSGSNNIQSTLLINQSTNALLGGSSFTYEAPLKSAKVSFAWEGASFFIAEDTEVTFGTDMSAGQLFSGDDYVLKFDMTHSIEIRLDDSDASWRTASQGIYYTNSTLYGCAFPLKIKATDGTTTKWLAPVLQGRYYVLDWVNSETSFVLHRGRQDNASPSSTLINDYNGNWDGAACTGLYENSDNKTGPCQTTPYYIQKGQNPGFVTYTTEFIFDAFIPPLDFDADLTINIGYPEVNIKQYGYEDLGYSANRYMPLTANVRRNAKGVINEFIFDKLDETSTDSKLNVYTTEQSSNTAIEQQDLGNVTIGQTSIDPKFSVRDSNKASIIAPFQVGTDATTSQNITRLITDQFLEMQVTPLQILQGSIQSAYISPLKVLKYKLNSDDADFGYYMFLGGTFKANSEIMDGEWFKLKKD